MRARSFILALSLLWQHTVVATAQVVLCCQIASAEAASGDDTICRCVHGPNAVCPMHHAASVRPTDGAPRWCAGCTEQTTVLLSGTSGDVGSAPPPRFRLTLTLASTAIPELARPPLEGTSPLILPPPRD